MQFLGDLFANYLDSVFDNLRHEFKISLNADSIHLSKVELNGDSFSFTLIKDSENIFWERKLWGNNNQQDISPIGQIFKNIRSIALPDNLIQKGKTTINEVYLLFSQIPDIIKFDLEDYSEVTENISGYFGKVIYKSKSYEFAFKEFPTNFPSLNLFVDLILNINNKVA